MLVGHADMVLVSVHFCYRPIQWFEVRVQFLLPVLLLALWLKGGGVGRGFRRVGILADESSDIALC